jgi:hypothetical protein
MQLDKEPIRSVLHSNRGISPQSESLDCGGIAPRQFAVLNAGKYPSFFPPAKVDLEWTLDNQWKGIGRPAASKVPSTAMGHTVVQWQGTLVDRIILSNLRVRRRGKREISIAPGIGKNLHFFIDAAEPSLRRVRQSPIAVYKSISRRTNPIFPAKASAGC